MRWPRSKKRVALLVLGALALMWLLRLNPSYHYSRITRGDGSEVEVERFGFGTQRTVVEQDDARIEVFNW